MAKAMAMLKGRDYVTPDDVQTVFCETVAHRLLLSAEAEARDVTAQQLLQDILHRTAAPRLR
jgi:MoxR-like ATPase